MKTQSINTAPPTSPIRTPRNPELTLDENNINVPRRLRDDNWSLDIGVLQRDLEKLSPKDTPCLQFNFTKCRWIDPLPALSLLIEMSKAKHCGFKVIASFPPIDEIKADDKHYKQPPDQQVKERYNPYLYSPNKLLRFFAREGYFSALQEIGILATVGKKHLNDTVISSCCSLDATPSYADATFIPFRIFDVPKLTNNTKEEEEETKRYAADTVASLLGEKELLLHSRYSPPERRHLLYTLRAVLQEFLHNVQEHAYPSEKYRPVALYVRYRKGGGCLSSGDEKTIYDGCVNEEFSHCEGTGRDWLGSRKGCLEVFFLDRGAGISRTLPSAHNPSKAFEELMREAFLEGKSSKTADQRSTQHGGLHLLHILLSRRNDYIRAHENAIWYGSAVPFIRPNAQVTKQQNKLLDRTSGNRLTGLAYHVRLSWRAFTDESEKWRGFSEKEADSVLAALRSPSVREDNPLARKGRVVDERFASNPIDIAEADYEYILWLPRRNLMKLDVLTKLENISKNISKPCRLIIADIPSIEAATYEAAISKSNFRLSEDWPKKYEWILLATNRWSFAYATYSRNYSDDTKVSHGFSPMSAEKISDYFISIYKTLKTPFRQLVVDWLKLHDSKCFWKEVNKSQQLFIAEEVIWEEDEKHNPTLIIDGYLDFPAATHNRYCAQLFRNALARIFGLRRQEMIELVPVDSLAAPIVHDLYEVESLDTPIHDQQKVIKIAVGSVLVSGATLGASALKDSSVHFFVRPESPVGAEHASLFYWMPDRTITRDQNPQRRIGKTSAIAPEGWLSIEIPRHDKEEHAVGIRHPGETYDDWQNPGPVIVKAGHWCYEGHHDFLTINIPDAVDDGFARNGPLAQFLVCNILYHLGISRRRDENIPENGHFRTGTRI